MFDPSRFGGRSSIRPSGCHGSPPIRTILPSLASTKIPLLSQCSLDRLPLQAGRLSAPDQTLSVGLENIDGEAWGGSVIVGGAELYFSFGHLTGGGGATVVYRPSAIFLDRVGTVNCKVMAFSWDRDTATVASAVRVTFGP
jgi:hypothetical protein